MRAAAELLALDPAHYSAHPLHGHDRDFRETNCYVDLLIELVHGLGLEPTASLGCTLSADFEGDQWTFFKQRTADLDALYGLRIEELCVWRPMIEQVQTQLARNSVPLIEVDSHYLPDLAGAEYHCQHTKTSIGVISLDPAARSLRYFHNAGLFALSGDDFDHVLGVGERAPQLPPYTEMVKLDAVFELPSAELHRRARELARHHYDRRPRSNPLASYARALPEHLRWVQQGGLPVFHAYSFPSLRQLGACYELGSSYLQFLDGGKQGPLAEAATDVRSIASTAKTLIMRLARAANSGKALDASASFDEMAQAWERAMNRVESGLS